MNIRTLLISGLMALVPAAAFAGDPVRNLSEKVKDNKVSFDYSFSISNSSVEGNGSVTAEDKAYKIESKGMDVYCDGTAKWTVDESAKEVIVEPLDQNASNYMTDPASLITSFDEYFSQVSTAQGKFDGKNVKICTLTPKAHLVAPISMIGKSLVIMNAQLYFTSKGNLVGMMIKAEDGSSMTFKVSNLIFSKKTGLEPFRFDTEGLSDDWVVTDLR